MPDTGWSPVPPPVFLWSAGVHIAVVLVILKLQQLTSRVTNPRGARYATISELLFSTAWVVMTLENTYLFIMWSELGGVMTLGLRVFFTSLVFHKVYGNPCAAFFYYLEHWPAKKLTTLLRPLCAQALAIPVGITIAIVMWRILAVVNTDYSIFLDKEIEYFLAVHPFVGFLIETAVSFLMFMPAIFLESSAFLNLSQSIFTVFLVNQFGVLTGAFMNPMAAFSCYLMWHSRYLGLWDLFVHVFVFFLGPLVGTTLAVAVNKTVKSKQS